MRSDLDPATVPFSSQSTSVAALERELLSGERVLVAAEACPRRFNLGVLAATTKRVIFARTRIFRPPLILSWDYSQIEAVDVGEAPLSGKLQLTTGDGLTTFDLIRPKERTHLLLWRIRERIGQLPLK